MPIDTPLLPWLAGWKMKAGEERSKRLDEQDRCSPTTLHFGEQLPFFLGGLSNMKAGTKVLARCGAGMKKSNWLQKPHLHRDPGARVGEHQPAASTPRIPALLMLQLSTGKVWAHLPHPSSSLVMKHLSFLPSYPASQGASSQLKIEGEGITYLSVQNYLGEEKPFVCTVFFF